MNPLLDWLGHGGKPVARELAEARAYICTTGFRDKDGNPAPCPENRAPRWWEWAKDPIADCIRERLEVKNAMQLRVESEESLAMCRVCGCCLRLKVWTPLDRITPNVDVNKFPEHCWIRRES